MSGREADDATDGLVPRDWAELSPLIDAVLDAPADRRASVVEALSRDDPKRRAALDRLVAECAREMPLLDQPASARFGSLANEPDVPLLPALLSDRYRTGRELGRGGMARVYLAHDTKHGRDVAIKVIRADLSASLGNERFLREIEIAARLRHPNIVPLYDSGEVGGSLYFVMPFEEGPSLRERLRADGALPISEALSVLRDVARALAYAHEHGVVHRDVKPDNVMLSGGAAVVADFGIAKAVSAALAGGEGTGLTLTGSGIGTPAYMAPEQAMGDPTTDHRADVYAFGCLAYELLTGAVPFPEASPHQIVAAHMTKVPPSVTEHRADVPAPVAALVAQCLEKLPADRPQSVRDVLRILDGTPSTTAPAMRHEPVVRASRRARAIQWSAGALVAVLVAVGGYLAARGPTRAAPITIAVLPFGNTAADTATEFLADGLPDEIASALARVPGIQIRSRSGARMYRGRLGVDVSEVGSRLGADYVMHGVLRRDRGRWILSADVTRTSDRTSVWGENLTLDPDQQARAVATITASLLTALRSQFPGSIGVAPTIATASSPLANELYLRGQWLLSRRGQSVRPSADMFRLAIQEDSLFAPAYSGLAMALALFPHFQHVTAASVADSVATVARRALRLNPGLAQPHVALGLNHQFALRWDSAEVEFRAAVAQDPHDVEARVQYARHLLFRGRQPEAMRHLRVARAEDPESALVLSWIAYGHYVDGRMDSALVASRRALVNDPKNYTSLGFGALIQLGAGRRAEARQLNDRFVIVAPLAGYIYARSGDPARARKVLADLDAQEPQTPTAHTRRFFTHLGLGDTARAFDAAEAATEAREIWPSMQSVSDPVFDNVRGSARFAALVRRVGLPVRAIVRRRSD